MQRMSINPQLLPTTLRKYARVIAYYSDERAFGEGIWVGFVPGLCHSPCEHVVHENTVAACARVLAEPLTCECADCLEGMCKKKESA